MDGEAWLQTGFPASSLHLQSSPKAIKCIDFVFLPLPANIETLITNQFWLLLSKIQALL